MGHAEMVTAIAVVVMGFPLALILLGNDHLRSDMKSEPLKMETFHIDYSFLVDSRIWVRLYNGLPLSELLPVL
jgi:hypothetical protein